MLRAIVRLAYKQKVIRCRERPQTRLCKGIVAFRDGI